MYKLEKMNIRSFWEDFTEMSTELNFDLNELWSQDFKNNSQVIRRAYCRALFSKIDGINSLLKQHAERFGDPDDETLLLLQDKKISKDTKQKVKSFRRPPDDLFFAIETFAWTIAGEPMINRNSEGWKKFEEAVKIRNRITHPKKKQDLIISNEDIKLLHKIEHWHDTQIIEILSFISKSLKKMAKTLKRNFYLKYPEAANDK